MSSSVKWIISVIPKTRSAGPPTPRGGRARRSRRRDRSRRRQAGVGARLRRGEPGEERALVARRARRTCAGCPRRWRSSPSARSRRRPAPPRARGRRGRRAGRRSGRRARRRGRQRDHAHPVAVGADVAGDLARPQQRRGEHEAHLPLLDHVQRLDRGPRLQPGVGRAPEAERVREPVRGLRRVAHVELDVVDAVQRHLVGGSRLRFQGGLDRHLAPLLDPIQPCRL